MADLEDMMADVFGMFDDISVPAVFQIGLARVSGHLSAATGTMEAPGGMAAGPKKYRVRAKFSISRARLTDKPKEQSIIKDADGIEYRIVGVASDAAEWLLTLATPE